MNSVLAGAGVWGEITSPNEWTEHGISLSQICRYPQEKTSDGNWLGYILSTTSPSVENPLEICIDLTNRKTRPSETYWIQFDHRYVGQDFTIFMDTENNGTYNRQRTFVNNIQPVWYWANHQEANRTLYRIKIVFTKALQIENLQYQDAGYTQYEKEYNPDGLIGIVNFGMAADEPFGRAFLGECGGNVYGNIDMHENILTNVGTPQEDHDVASKAYVDDAIANSGGGNIEIPQVAPYVGDNGNWYSYDYNINEFADTGIKAEGKDGYTPVKGIDYWTDEEIAAIKKYLEEYAQDRAIMFTPYIDTEGYWYVDDTNLGVKAEGKDGYTPVRGVDYWTTEDKAEIKSYVNDAILGGAW